MKPGVVRISIREGENFVRVTMTPSDGGQGVEAHFDLAGLHALHNSLVDAQTELMRGDRP